jgi:DNA invertase Pin-like site-specific DNA recombinase
MPRRPQEGERYVPIDERDPTTVRAVILARSSDPGSKPEDMRSQVDQCQEFIERHGWRLIADPYAYTEAKSGMRNVSRPVLDEVLALAVNGVVDVIVCRELERVARNKMRRYQAIQTALDYGVEFRFANLPPDGRLPDDPANRMYLAFLEEFGAMEAERIVERLTPGRLQRFRDGLPHGGSNGPSYGYAEGERARGKHGREKGVLNWMENPETARWVRWLYDTADQTDIADLSLRGLARELERRGVAAPSGGAHWSATAVQRILREPKYAGRGRAYRYQTAHLPRRDQDSRKVRERRSISVRSLDETYPIPESTVPRLIEPEVWERVQAKLDALPPRGNRGPRRSDALAHSTLLDGFVHCAHCGNRMTRYWLAKQPYPYYQCNIGAGRPSHPCKRHSAPAPRLDALALQLLARALTDPQKILELADAAEQQRDAADTEATLAASAIAAYTARLTEIVEEQDALMRARDALDRVPGMEAQIEDIRARLRQLDDEAAEVTVQRSQTLPHRDHAQERQRWLEQLTEHRRLVLNFAAGSAHWAGEVRLRDRLSSEFAAGLLGVSPAELDLQQEFAGFVDDPDDPDAAPTAEFDVDRSEVVERMLHTAPRKRLRKLLRDLEVVVLVSRPWSATERAIRGKTPLEARVQLQMMGVVSIRVDETKLKDLGVEP